MLYVLIPLITIIPEIPVQTIITLFPPKMTKEKLYFTHEAISYCFNEVTDKENLSLYVIPNHSVAKVRNPLRQRIIYTSHRSIPNDEPIPQGIPRRAEATPRNDIKSRSPKYHLQYTKLKIVCQGASRKKYSFSYAFLLND